MHLILGFTNRTSLSLAKHLKGAVISDIRNTPSQKAMLEGLDCIDELGRQDVSLLDDYPVDKIFISPGVPRTLPLVQEALDRGITVTNDIEYFYTLHPQRRYAAVTGTDGKTTTVLWLAHVLGDDCVLAGNIGTPIFQFADDRYKDKIMIIELSSFQLESLDTFKADTALITNISPDHLDRYKSFEHYASVKKNIFRNQSPQDTAVINTDDALIAGFAEDAQSAKISFSLDGEGDLTLQDGFVLFNGRRVIDTAELKLKGLHNVQNAMSVFAAAYSLGLPADIISERITGFKGAAHRMEYAGEHKGVRFYNDSKATTVQSVKSAVQSFGGNVILLAGGRGKGLDYGAFPAHKHAKKIFLFGEEAGNMQQSWGGSMHRSLKEAFEEAVSCAESGDTVLLSPAAASFDEFSSYEERGDCFKALVKNLQ